jgi:hypothetical protein
VVVIPNRCAAASRGFDAKQVCGGVARFLSEQSIQSVLIVDSQLSVYIADVCPHSVNADE